MSAPAPPPTGRPAGSWLEGRLERVLWASDDGGYAVVKIGTSDGSVTAVGDLALLADEANLDDFIAIEGHFEDHPVHGRQFRATGFLHGLPRTLEGLVLYLSQAGIPGVGRTLAERIVERFGVSAIAVLSDTPERLAEVPGVGAARVQAIRDRWDRDAHGAALSVRLRGLGLSARVVRRIREKYGEEAAAVVAREPYRLTEDIAGVGFRTADALAREQGLPEDDPARLRAAARFVLQRAESDGHAYLDRARLSAAVAELGVPTQDLHAALDVELLRRRLIVEPARPSTDPFELPPPDPGDRIYLPHLLRAEVEIAEAVAARVAVGPGGDPGAEIAAAEAFEGVALGDDQRAAVAAALGAGVVVVTGGPGTGKTTLVRVLLRVLRERGVTWALASPTGRAARRLEEATGQPASTLHRLLELRPAEGGFQRGPDNPLEIEGLVVDEVSMVDLPLMAALLRALPPEVPLVLVGDADQLPSVGPGQVLHDLLASGIVPVVRLGRVYRQEEGSGILAAAAAIQAGSVPPPGGETGRRDCFFLDRGDPARAVETVLTVVAERLPALGFDPMEAVQVLTPVRRGPLGTEGLNKVLQDRLNPDGEPIVRTGRTFRLGDRVICTRNRYDVEVFNGDAGRIVGADREGLVVVFDGRRVPWTFDELSSLELAYALTVHKSQGSEYAAVVLVLHPAHGIMLRRNLFYTAVTRARDFLCVVGAARAWARAVGQTGGDERWTTLAERLRVAAQPAVRMV
jgi:exodeoxyribonuclease V alpha subunit